MLNNYISKIILIALLVFAFKLQIYGQTAEVSITVTVNGSNVDVSLFIKRTGGTAWNLGISSLVFNYNSTALAYSSEYAEGIWDNNTSTDYDDQYSSNYGGIARSTEIDRPTEGGSGTDIPQTATLVGTLRFTVIPGHNGELHNITWNQSFSFFSTYSGTSVSNSNITFTDPPNGPVPIELTSFIASVNKNIVELKWETKTEVNNYGFEVERRVGDGKLGVGSWEEIGFVSGSGNSNSPKEYSLTDKNPVGGSKFIYRLKQIDNDGKYEYSKEVEVELVPNEYELYQNYPNPFNPITNIKFALPKSAKVNLSIYNLLGEKVATILNEEKEAGYYNVKFDGSRYSSGVYIFRLSTEDFVQIKKMNLIK
jgi:hypothetical protein